MLSVAGDRKPADLDVVVGTLPRQDSNLRPVDTEHARPRAREQKTKRLASRKSRRRSRNAPESHPADRTQTVPTEKERDG